MSPSRALRVAVDGRSLCGNRTGVGTYTANLLDAMLRLDPGLRLLPIVAEEPPPFSWLKSERVEVSRSDAFRRNNFLWTNLSLRGLIRKRRVSVFHSPGYTLPLFPSFRTIVTLHDVSYAAAPQWYPYRLGALRRAWYRAAARQADAVLTDSEFSRREIVRTYQVRESRIRVVYLGVDRTLFRPDGRVDRESLVEKYALESDFLFLVGDIHPRRNLIRIVDAINRVRGSEARFRTLQVVVAGRFLDPPEGSRDARALLESPALKFVGYVPEGDLAGLYRLARALIYPSFYEGFGLPVLEAMASGCPAIVGRETACSEIGNGAVLTVDPSSVPSISEAILGVLMNPEIEGRCRKSGLARAEEFTWKRAAEETLEVYRKVGEFR